MAILIRKSCYPNLLCSDEGFNILVQRFTMNDGGAEYSLGNPISSLLSFLLDGSQMEALVAFAAKYDGNLLDASDFIDEAAAHISANQRFLQSFALPLCSWLQQF